MMMERSIELANRVGGIVVVLLSLSVSVPLTVKVYLEGGGPWGFGIIGLPVLITLSAYILFGIVGLIRSDSLQRKMFIAAHFITFGISAIVMFIFPVYPALLVSIPLLLAVVGLISYSKHKYYLLLMLVLSVVFNGLLWKWEHDFHRPVPVLQLFESGTVEAP